MGVIGGTDINSLYTDYSILKFYGNYSNFEIDDMIPFEREVYMSLLKKNMNDVKEINK